MSKDKQIEDIIDLRKWVIKCEGKLDQIDGRIKLLIETDPECNEVVRATDKRSFVVGELSEARCALMEVETRMEMSK